MTDLSARLAAYRAFEAADNAWSAELKQAFGRHAGDMRYRPEGRGVADAKLRELYQEFCRTRDAWWRALDLVETENTPAL